MTRQLSIPSINRAVWRSRGEAPVMGVNIRNGTYAIFIPADSLRAFSDYMVDAAEEYEQNGTFA